MNRMMNRMTNRIVTSFVVFLALYLVSAPAIGENAQANHPCKAVAAACEAAGFVKNGHHPKKGSNKGLWVDCFHPLLAGQSVPGVTVDAATVTACKEKKASFKQE